jgi:cytochrome c-type biogenesis protein CcmH
LIFGLFLKRGFQYGLSVSRKPIMMFWVLIAAIVLGVVAALTRGVLRHPTAPELATGQDIGVYKDHMGEIERDMARGLISADEAEHLRLEISHRILAADRAMQAATTAQPPASRQGPLPAAVILCLFCGAVATLIYLKLGAPGYDDLALSDRITAAKILHETRPAQIDAERRKLTAESPDAASTEFQLLMVKLRAAMRQRPNDLKGQTLLARNEAALGHYTAAYKAQEQVLRLKQTNAVAEDYALYADMLVYAAGGYVSPQAEIALQVALERDPQHPKARYYMGLTYAQTGRPDVAFRIWRDVLYNDLQDPALQELIEVQIGAAAQLAGVRYDPLESQIAAGPTTTGSATTRPTATRPSTADITAANDMTAEDRSAMIAGMVFRLSQRLATEGGPASDWARLIDAYGVLGNAGKAKAIWRDAQEVFAGKPDALHGIAASARRAGFEP